MGEYFRAVCHTCRITFAPVHMKAREIFLNSSAAAEVGRFCTFHLGHRLELRGDEYNYDPDETIDGYGEHDSTEETSIRSGKE